MALELFTAFNCCPVFLGKELKEEYYKGEQQPLPSHTQVQAGAACYGLHLALHCRASLGHDQHLVSLLGPRACRLLQAAAVAAVPLPHTAVPDQRRAV